LVAIGKELPTVTNAITQAKIDRYAAASGDFNPIHVDPEFAATTQFGGTIAHGMMVAAAISQSMTELFNKDWFDSGKLKIRFKVPVRPGDLISTFGQVKNIRELGRSQEVVCAVGVCKQDGEIAIVGEAAVLVPYTA